MCGTRAGKHGRLSKPASYTHTTHDDSCSHKTYTQEQSFHTSGNAFPTSTKKIPIVIVILVVVLINIAVAFFPIARRAFEDMTSKVPAYPDVVVNEPSASEPRHAVRVTTDISSEPETVDSAPVLNYLVVEGDWTVPSPTALSVTLSALDDGSYTLACDGYKEQGWIWLWQNAAEEALHRVDYPPEQYDSYTLCLEGVTTDATIQSSYPPALDERIDDIMYGEDERNMWMLLYQHKESGARYLDPFGQNTYGMLADEPSEMSAR